MKSAAIAILAGTMLAGCATIFNGSTQAVNFQSAPEGATLTITNAAGEKIHSGVTPAMVTLKRGAGYFKPETYTVTLSKEGFAPREIQITGTLGGWYFGNILFGGLIGMLAVDPVTGAMFNLPESVNKKLEGAAAKTSGLPGTLTVVSTDSLTPEQMQRATLLVAAK